MHGQSQVGGLDAHEEMHTTFLLYKSQVEDCPEVPGAG